MTTGIQKHQMFTEHAFYSLSLLLLLSKYPNKCISHILPIVILSFYCWFYFYKAFLGKYWNQIFLRMEAFTLSHWRATFASPVDLHILLSTNRCTVLLSVPFLPTVWNHSCKLSVLNDKWALPNPEYILATSIISNCYRAVSAHVTNTASNYFKPKAHKQKWHTIQTIPRVRNIHSTSTGGRLYFSWNLWC